MIVRWVAALGGNHQRSPWDKEAYDLHRLLEDSAAVAPEVIHKLLHSLLLEALDAFPDHLGDVLREAALIDIAGGVVDHSNVFYIREMYTLTGDVHILYGARAELLYLEDKLGSGSAFHTVAALLRGEAYDAYAVNLHNLVSADKAGLVGRGTLVRLVDGDVTVHVRLVDNRAHSTVSTVEHHLQVFVFLFRDIYGIWVQRLKHSVNSHPFNTVNGEGVNVRIIEFLEKRLLDFRPFAQIEIPGLSECNRATQHGGCQHYYFLAHIYCKNNKFVL